MKSVRQAQGQLSGAEIRGVWPDAEIRGVWIDRSSLVSRDEMRATLQNLAAANFNLAFVNVWSRGYPLWRSRVFEHETGLPTDPGFNGRDVLAEFIEEARDAGIAVMPWAEYGFIGGYSGYLPGPGGRGPIFERHPGWLARTSAGVTQFTAPGGFFYWMSHTHPEVQEFLLALMEELARNYPIAGIQFDRVRYPQLDCGYDDYTVQLYRQENNGAAPPADGNNAAWMRWRADKANQFVKSLWLRLKGVNRNLAVNNAPIVHPFGYVNFAQEYPAWLRDGALDFATPQIYRRTAAEYEAELDRQLGHFRQGQLDTRLLVPGIDITNSNSAAELIRMIEITRQRQLPGVVVWYYRGLLNAGAFDRLRATVFATRAPLPWERTRSGAGRVNAGRQVMPEVRPD
ncbi:MAG: glycoside hydrolase family 10 protein [Blastocatellia bacterium]